MTKKKDAPVNKFPRYFSVLLKQSSINYQFIYFMALGTIIDIGLWNTVSFWAWGFLAIINILVGVMAMASVVGPVDKAFESIGLNFDKGYGKPLWIVNEKYPLRSDIFRISAAGYTAEDFTQFLGQISSRLNQPIKLIRKPSASLPVIEVVLKRSNIPSELLYEDLPLAELKQGQIFVGKSDDGFEKLELSKMIHMLVAGQTGQGKTYFLKQVITTVAVQTRNSHVCVIDMKGGIDYQAFSPLANFEMATTLEAATAMMNNIVELFELRRNYLVSKQKTSWSEVSVKDLARETSMSKKPLGPVIVVIDELAELSKSATKNSVGKGLQEKIETIARLARVTGVHLVVGTQRPSKDILPGASKDNLQTRICFFLPSVTASTLVVGDMSATSLGAHPGRGIYQVGGSKESVQTPFITNSKVTEIVDSFAEKQKSKNEKRTVLNTVAIQTVVQEEGAH